VNAFDVPIRQAFLVQMVGKDDLPNAIALNSSMFNSARVVGPPIAGIVIAYIHEGWCFFLNGVSFLAVIAALLAMRIPKFEPKVHHGSQTRHLLQGFRYAMQDRPTRAVLLLLSVMSFFGLQYSVFLPVFARDILHRGAVGFSLLLSYAGIGAALGALQFAARRSFKGLAKWIAGMAIISSVCLIAFSYSRVFWISAAVLFVVGFAATSMMAATNTTVQNRVPDELRSRVMAVYAMMFMGVQPIGSLVAGGVAKHIGAPRTLEVFGVIVLTASVAFAVRMMMRMRAAVVTAGG
jgi:predicted MFS family arabinose efflux permease